MVMHPEEITDGKLVSAKSGSPETAAPEPVKQGEPT